MKLSKPTKWGKFKENFRWKWYNHSLGDIKSYTFGTRHIICCCSYSPRSMQLLFRYNFKPFLGQGPGKQITIVDFMKFGDRWARIG